MNTPSSGVEFITSGFALIFKRGLRRYALIPILVNILVYILLFALGYHFMHEVILWADHLLPKWLHWLNWIIWPLFIVSNIIFLIYTFTLIANIIAAPFNSFLAEKIELMETAQKYEDSAGWMGALKDIPRTMGREWQKVKYYLGRAIILFILTFIPGVNIISSILWFFFGSWMMAVQYLDYPMDNHKTPFKAMMAQLHARRFSTLGFGICALMLSFIPIVNLFAMPASVAGATLKWVEHLKASDEEKNASKENV